MAALTLIAFSLQTNINMTVRLFGCNLSGFVVWQIKFAGARVCRLMQTSDERTPAEMLVSCAGACRDGEKPVAQRRLLCLQQLSANCL